MIRPFSQTLSYARHPVPQGLCSPSRLRANLAQSAASVARLDVPCLVTPAFVQRASKHAKCTFVAASFCLICHQLASYMQHIP